MLELTIQGWLTLNSNCGALVRQELENDQWTHGFFTWVPDTSSNVISENHRPSLVLEWEEGSKALTVNIWLQCGENCENWIRRGKTTYMVLVLSNLIFACARAVLIFFYQIIFILNGRWLSKYWGSKLHPEWRCIILTPLGYSKYIKNDAWCT